MTAILGRGLLILLVAAISRKDGASVLVEGLLPVATTTGFTRNHRQPSVFHNNEWISGYGRQYPESFRRSRIIHNPSLTLHTTNDNSNNNASHEGNPRNISYLRSLLFGDRGGKHGSNYHGTPRRILSIGAVTVSSFAAYLLGTAILNRTIVDKLGVSRGGDAFGPFATLLSLIYSIVLGQIYHYYFERQQMIQNCLYEEAAALQLLFHVSNSQENKNDTTSTCLEENTNENDHVRRLMYAPLKTYTESFLRTAFDTNSSYRLRQDGPRKLVELASIYDTTLSAQSSAQSSSRCRMVANAIQAATSARALRVSHVNSDLPVVQKTTERLLSYVILGGFVLVDLKAPILEALLFSVIAGCFTTIHGFLMDLSDPFSGQWTVGTHIRKDLEDLISMM